MQTDKAYEYYATLVSALKRKIDDPEFEWADVAEAMHVFGEDPKTARDYIRRSSTVAMELIQNGWVCDPRLSESACDTRDESQNQCEHTFNELVKLRDERNAIARMKREMARRESIVEILKQAIHEETDPLDGYSCENIDTFDDQADTDRELIINLSDLHCGMNISNWTNEFNETVLMQRLEDYAGKICGIAKRHHINKCHVQLGGDMVSGLIHPSIRAENNMDVILQVKYVSKAIACFLRILGHHFLSIDVYSVPGNHGRINARIEENLKGENLDILVPCFVSAYLSECTNIMVHEENAIGDLSAYEVCGNRVVAVHGDKDTPENVVQRMTMFLGAKPDIVLMGHRHTNGMRTVFDSKVIESGCMSGTDSFCMDHRLRNKPEQSVVVVSKHGVECLYNINFI